jgi:hypothetical protein
VDGRRGQRVCQPHFNKQLECAQRKKRLRLWDNRKRHKSATTLPHPGNRLTPFSGVNHLVSRCPTKGIAITAPERFARGRNAISPIKIGAPADSKKHSAGADKAIAGNFYTIR